MNWKASTFQKISLKKRKPKNAMSAPLNLALAVVMLAKKNEKMKKRMQILWQKKTSSKTISIMPNLNLKPSITTVNDQDRNGPHGPSAGDAGTDEINKGGYDDEYCRPNQSWRPNVDVHLWSHG